MGIFGGKDMPSAGQQPGGGRGRKPARLQVNVTTDQGTMLWKQTSGLFGGKKKTPPPAKAAKPQPAPKRHRWFNSAG